MSKDINKVRISSLIDIAKIITQRYKHNFHEMTVIVSYKVKNDCYAIVQELKSFPLKNITANEINNSLFLVAEWGWGKQAPYKDGLIVEQAMAKKGTSYMEWNDILTYKEINMINSSVNKIGTYRKEWALNNEFYKNKYKFNFRIENIIKVLTYEWGFEILSDHISLIAVKTKSLFPYEVFDSFDTSKRIIMKKTISGYCFKLSSKEKDSYYSTENEILSYWIPKHENNDDDEDFNKIMNELVNDNVVQKTQNIGQRNIADILDLED